MASHETLSSARGYSPDHPRIDLLQVKDIFAGRLAPAAWLSIEGGVNASTAS